MAKNRTIESGVVGNNIWIGRHAGFYEPVRIGALGRQLHVLRFTVKETEMVIEMLQEEVARMKKPMDELPGISR